LQSAGFGLFGNRTRARRRTPQRRLAARPGDTPRQRREPLRAPVPIWWPTRHSGASTRRDRQPGSRSGSGSPDGDRLSPVTSARVVSTVEGPRIAAGRQQDPRTRRKREDLRMAASASRISRWRQHEAATSSHPHRHLKTCVPFQLATLSTVMERRQGRLSVWNGGSWWEVGSQGLRSSTRSTGLWRSFLRHPPVKELSQAVRVGIAEALGGPRKPTLEPALSSSPALAASFPAAPTTGSSARRRERRIPPCPA
jgi:hypothetical protein